MKNYNIRNLKDLQAKKLELKVDYTLRETMLKADGKAYLKQFTISSLVKKYLTPSNFLKADENLNISGTVMSFLLPFLMNNTLFRGSGLITKGLVRLASGKLGKSLDIEHLSAIFNSVKGWFGKSKSRKERKFIDYGIPPNSETY